MTQTKHTPGDWRYDRDHTAVVTDRTIIAQLGAPYPMMRDEMDANGRLIAEAPAMRAKLAETANICDDLTGLLPPAKRRIADAVAEIRALLTRIDGSDDDPNPVVGACGKHFPYGDKSCPDCVRRFDGGGR